MAPGISLTGTTIITSFSASTESNPKPDEKLTNFPPPPIDSGMSLKQPAWHVLVLGVVTFKLYFIYWSYKNWRDLSAQIASLDARDVTAGELINAAPPDATDLREATKTEILAEQPSKNSDSKSFIGSISPSHLSSFRECSPHLRALACMIPYVGSYLFFTLALGIARLRPQSKSFIAQHPLIWAGTLAFFNAALQYLAICEGALYLIFLLSIVPMIIVQHELNKFWDTVEKPGLLTRHGFTFKELVVIIAGALYMGYIVAGFMIAHK